jgi:HSP20 family molecular chaperone IbpA
VDPDRRWIYITNRVALGPLKVLLRMVWVAVDMLEQMTARRVVVDLPGIDIQEQITWQKIQNHLLHGQDGA